jgi:hypothetical protein
LRGADGRFGTALYARGQVRALAFLPLSPRSRDPSFQRPGPRRRSRPLRNQRSRCHRLWKQRLPGRTLTRWRLDSTNSAGYRCHGRSGCSRAGRADVAARRSAGQIRDRR